ncbi:MAG: iron-containing alcohol dehydrogenase [Myxococcota bacterium]|nr:iron-containing alcohol dehydrogenase [Myxococcota bacterium]
MPLIVLDGGLSTASATMRSARADDSDSEASWTSLSMDCEARSLYRVDLCDPLLRPGSTVLREVAAGRKTLVVTTPSVEGHYGAALRAMLTDLDNVATLVLGVREETKSLDLVATVCKEALAHGLNRRGLLIGVGGGVCLDVVTLSASLIRRGVGHIRVPTTLIGQIDAGVGLKGAVNFSGKKSFIGCFHPPERVLIDPTFLQTLPPRFVVSGLAEAFKMGIARDARLFEMLETCSRELVKSGFGDRRGREVLERAIFAMLAELRKNPYENQSYERLVDFGHTFSPALEAAVDFSIHHGEAVAVDMALSAGIARALGLVAQSVFERIVSALHIASLPVFAPKLDVQLCHEALVEATRHRGGAVNLVVPTGIGRTAFLKHLDDVPDSIVAQALALVSSFAAENP